MRDFRELQVWRKAHAFALAAYKITASFPREETYGLSSQIRRASVSIAANIAEGCGRSADGDLHRFLVTSMGSASEVEYELLLAHDLGYIKDATYKQAHEQIVEVKRMLASLARKVDIARLRK